MTSRLSIHIFLILFITALFSSCSEDKINPDATGILSGKVIDLETMEPLVLTNITTNPSTQSVMTDSTGTFMINNVPPADYKVIAKKSGYISQSISLTISADDTTKAEIALEKRYTIEELPIFTNNIFPGENATDIDVNTKFYWEVENTNDSVTYSVYLYEAGSENNPQVYTSLPDTFLEIDNLIFNTDYIWQVNAKNKYGHTNGTIRHFKTLPFPENSILFSKLNDEVSQLYVSDTLGDKQKRISRENFHMWKPAINKQHNMLSFLSSKDIFPQLYVMNLANRKITQITDISGSGYHTKGLAYCWDINGGKLYFSAYNALYSINSDGSNQRLITKAPEGKNFREMTFNFDESKLLLMSLGEDLFDQQILIFDLSTNKLDTVYQNEKGIISSPVFSIDGTAILFTKDISGFRSLEGRQLNTHIYRMDIGADTLIDLSEHKPMGTNDLNPMYSPDGSKIVFVNCSNVIGAQKNIWVMDADGNNRRKIIEGASDPYWYQ
jgi:TolB protein